MNKNRVVVTGLGVVSSIGIGKDAFWDNLIKGVSGISKVDLFDTGDQFNHFGGQVRNFDAEKYVNKKKIRFIGKSSQFAIAAAKLAVHDAQIKMKEHDSERVAVYMGTTGGESQSIEEIDTIWLKKGREDVKVESVLQYPVNNISANVATELKCRGKNRMFTNACAAGNYAIGYGFDSIMMGKADMVIAGGVDVFSYIIFTGFNQLGAVAPERCQPFDKNRKGMIPGEGAGILVLESLENALKRKAHIYAEILGYGLSCDASHMTQPNIEGVTACMQNALKEPSTESENVDYISAHGTGTKFNDKVESGAINKVFGGHKVAVSSIKSMLGHTMGAASAIEAISCCLTVQNDVIPPNINYETPDPECDINCVANYARKQRVNIALNNAFAFGGNNSCLVIKKYN